jgi:hypothetical protein
MIGVHKNIKGLTVSPAILFVKTPLCVDLISTVTLSVSTITMTSSTATASPSALDQEAMEPSVIDSPKAGTFSCGIVTSKQFIHYTN